MYKSFGLKQRPDISHYPIDKKYSFLLPLILASITFCIFFQTTQNGFVNWDDATYVYSNHNIQSIDTNFFRWIFTSFVLGNWHPVTIISLAFDYAIWEKNPFGYHLTNTIIHTLNTLLVYFLVNQLAKAGKQIEENRYSLAFITAMLFGIHPIHTESVAWISERKDLLCGFFFLLSLITYIKHHSPSNSNKPRTFLFLVFFSAMSLLSKPMAVTLPIIFIILDYYPLQRINFSTNFKSLNKLLLEKSLFFILSLFIGIVTIMAQGDEEAISSLMEHDIYERVYVALKGYIFYLTKIFFPVHLAPLYPLPQKINFLGLNYLIPIALFCIFSFVAVLVVKKHKVLSATWFYYVITLIPAIGIIQVGSQAAADRYTYLPSIGPFLLVALSIDACYKKKTKLWQKTCFQFVMIICLILLGIKTTSQISIWNNSISLWSHQIKIYPERSFKAYFNRAIAFKELALLDKALQDYNKAIQINPFDKGAYYDRGMLLVLMKKHDSAIKDFSMTINLSPSHIKAYNNRGGLYAMKGLYDKAIDDLKKVLELDEHNAFAYQNLASIYIEIGNIDKAVAYREKRASTGR